MRTKGFLSGLTLIACLSMGAVSITGCDDESDPATYVKKLDADNKRPAAMRRLREMFQSRLSTAHPPDNVEDPAVKQFLDAALPAVVTAFTSHAEEVSTRKEAIEILAGAHDVRAVPGLLSALDFHLGNTDSERIALRAAQAIKDLHPRDPAVVTKLLATIDRASANSGNSPSIREAVIGALGLIGNNTAVDSLKRLLQRPIRDQEIRTARASADALGLLGDASAGDALIYGLFLNIRSGSTRQNAYNNCARALVRLGPDVAVPRLIATIRGENVLVNDLLHSYEGEPGMPPMPPGFVKSQTLDVMRNFADARSIDTLLALVRDRQEVANVRAAAAETLAYTALGLPREDPRRNAIYDALAAVFVEAAPGAETDMAPSVAPALVVLGDPRAPQLIARRLGARELQSADSTAFRMALLMPLASATRHGDFADFERIANQSQSQLDQLLREHPDAESEVRPVLNQLATIRSVASVAHDCNDGDLACYQTKLRDQNKDVVRKAAYMIAWTGGENAEARAALLGRVDIPDMMVRRSINTAIDTLSPHGCAECVTRLQAIIDNEAGQESKSVMHLESQMLMARLRNRH
jgi:HEAT repeat protein